jgi:hypothetical protein
MKENIKISITNPELQKKVDEIKDTEKISGEIKEYENKITDIESGKGYNDKSDGPSTIDQLHQKISDAERKLGILGEEENTQKKRDEIKEYEEK